MTIFAVMCAGMFPLLHLGRPWLFYWILPYPNTHDYSAAVPQSAGVGCFRCLHLFHGLAAVLVSGHDSGSRHAARPLARTSSRMRSTAFFAGAGAGASRHWKLHETASLLLAGLATPLVLSVHTVVSFDFTIAILPGWHSTIFPPYFVAGAIYSGFAMVLVLAIPIRAVFGLQNLITERHINNCAKLMLATGLILAYTYASSRSRPGIAGISLRCSWFTIAPSGLTRGLTGRVIACNVAIPQLLWFQPIPRAPSRCSRSRWWCSMACGWNAT